jgi:hypothetical protein
MKNNEKPSTSSESKRTTPHDVAKSGGQKIDRPGFDLSGSADDTRAGTGLGLGEDASDTPGDRRLPGRRLDGKLTIPRWSGPELHDTTASDKKTGDGHRPQVLGKGKS